MAAIIPRPSRTRLHTKSRPTPPGLKLQETTPQQSLTLSDNSSSSNNSHPGPGPKGGRGSGATSPDPHSGSSGSAHSGLASFHGYSAPYPSYRPYTPTTPTTPGTAYTPMTPTSSNSGFGLGFPISPRLDPYSGRQGNPGGLYPTFPSKGQRTRRIPSNDTSLYDPYRSRQPGVSANRVKSDYQAQSPIRESHATFPSTYHGGRGSSEDLHEIPPHLLDSALTDEQAFAMMHAPPAAVHREDLYRSSPTLTASQTLAANYSRPDSPFQSYQSYYQPYTQLPSPLILESGSVAYRSNTPASGYSSPALNSSPYMEERSESRAADPYRSAYSQQHQQSSTKGDAHFASPYLGSQNTHSPGSSPIMNEDFSSSFESRYSGTSHNKYPMLALQDSNQALSSFYDGHAKTVTTAFSDRGGGAHTDSELRDLDQELDMSASGISAGEPSSMHTKTSTSALQSSSQPSKVDSSGTQKAQTVEDAENDVILQKLGVISKDSGTRSAMTHSSGRSRRKGQWTDDSEEEGRSRGAARRRSSSQRRRRKEDEQCLCCSRKACLGLTFSFIVCLAITLFFVVPRSPTFTFESVMSDDIPWIGKDRIREPFTIQIMVDSRNNYLPIRVESFDVTIWLKMSGDKIADNYDLPSEFVIEPRMTQVLNIPMRLDYKAQALTDGEEDSTFAMLVQACTPVNDTSMAARLPKLDLTVGGRLHVWGLSLVWKPEFRLSVEDVPCPSNANPSGHHAPSRSPIRPPMPSVTANATNPASPASATTTTLPTASITA
ncbi:hypothetical protein BG000_010332 [Podila horticola]|nr:hypothetical protein BG000_010332 [Podila horticola]